MFEDRFLFLGLAEGPAQALLLPELPESELQLLRELVQGKGGEDFEEYFQSINLNPALRFYRLALAGDFDSAVAALQEDLKKNLQDQDHDLYSVWLLAYNSFVLTGAPLKQDSHPMPPLLQKLAEAVAFYQNGIYSGPATQSLEQLLGLRDESALAAAYLLVARGHFLAGQGELAESLESFDRAFELASKSPLFAARIYHDAASYLLQAGFEKAIDYLEQAHALLNGTSFVKMKATLSLDLGIACQSFALSSRARLLKAIDAYQRALLYFRKENHPAQYGLAQMNLGIVYMSMPMNEEAERVRPAIAVQALREALKVFDRERDELMWSSATLNLANALQHVPSTHNKDNLIEAVSLYQEILAVRRQEDDALAFARVHANLGNALAHLGAFAQARQSLEAARAIFEEKGEGDSADAVLTIMREMEEARK
ncbi:MAG: tetratricopeptide repeat protein [Candidatus Obscuribacter phosphatis]|uniref:Tetratricopeptide repeat protein n=1 Tax=Candidatus Obscuribacter phosphatis TaxID=1906157 RepID=A0A8J7TMH4_9BACT|nr:tetratricopeptide repeat protein [Candidatus Obscuribacter phosphatis]